MSEILDKTAMFAPVTVPEASNGARQTPVISARLSRRSRRTTLSFVLLSAFILWLIDRVVTLNNYKDHIFQSYLLNIGCEAVLLPLLDQQTPKMLTIKSGKNLVSAFLVLSFLLAGCGGGGGDTQPSDDGQVLEVPEVPDVPVPNFEFQLDENFFNTSSAEYVELIVDQIGGAIEPLNRIDNVFRENMVPVIYGECGVANAFYLPQQRRIVVCDELADVAFTYFQSVQEEEESEGLNLFLLEQTFNMMTFIIYHEMGHALDDLRDLSIGGNFESVADAIGVVLSVETGQPLAGIDAGLFFFSNENVSFADEHGSGEDRAGDIFCWVIGSNSLLEVQFPTIATGFTDAGRDCVAEYANQFDFVAQLLPNLQDIPARASLKSRRSEADADRFAVLDRLIAARLGFASPAGADSGS